MSSNISSLYNSPFFFFPFSKVLIFVECCKFVNNSFPRCFDVSIFVSHMRGKIVLLSCIDFRDRCSSFKLFKNVLYLLMSFGSCCLWFISNLLADVSHLGFLLSVHVFSSAVCCCSAPPTNYSLCVFVVVMCCWCSDSPIISSLLPFRRRGMPISFSCLFNRCCCMLANEPLFLFISSTCFVDSFCWLCVIFTCFHWCRLSLVSIIVAKMFHDQCCPLLTLQRMGIGNAQQLICGPSPNEPCRLPHRRYNFFCFFCEIADCWVVYLSHSQVWRWIAFQALLWMLFWAPHRSESSTTVSSSCYVCWVPPLHDFQRSDSQKQSVEIARDDRNMFLVAVWFDVFEHLLDVNVCVHWVKEVTLASSILSWRHLIVVVIRFCDLSFPSVLQEYANSMISSEATSAHVYMTTLLLRVPLASFELFEKLIETVSVRCSSILHFSPRLSLCCVFPVCLCCKMFIGTSLRAFESAPRPQTVSLGWLLTVTPSPCFVLSFW